MATQIPVPNSHQSVRAVMMPLEPLKEKLMLITACTDSEALKFLL